MTDNDLQINMATMQKDIEYIKAGHADLKTSVDNGFEALSKKIDCLDEKFASKWVESALVWTMRIVIGAVIVALLSLIIIK